MMTPVRAPRVRRGWLGSSMPFARVIPHSDAAGVIDTVGEGVDAYRTGQRVWVYGAQSYRPFGTAARSSQPKPPPWGRRYHPSSKLNTFGKMCSPGGGAVHADQGGSR